MCVLVGSHHLQEVVAYKVDALPVYVRFLFPFISALSIPMSVLSAIGLLVSDAPVHLTREQPWMGESVRKVPAGPRAKAQRRKGPGRNHEYHEYHE